MRNPNGMNDFSYRPKSLIDNWIELTEDASDSLLDEIARTSWLVAKLLRGTTIPLTIGARNR